MRAGFGQRKLGHGVRGGGVGGSRGGAAGGTVDGQGKPRGAAARPDQYSRSVGRLATAELAAREGGACVGLFSSGWLSLGAGAALNGRASVALVTCCNDLLCRAKTLDANWRRIICLCGGQMDKVKTAASERT